jgi:hypothetical protein
MVTLTATRKREQEPKDAQISRGRARAKPVLSANLHAVKVKNGLRAMHRGRRMRLIKTGQRRS